MNLQLEDIKDLIIGNKEVFDEPDEYPIAYRECMNEIYKSLGIEK